MESTLFTKLQNFRAALNCAHLEREHIVDGLLATLLSRQNAFLLGLPGTGKSDLIRSICGGIEQAKYFGYLLSPTTDPSELFGPVAVTKLLKDEYTRDVEGYLPSCNIAFLDELFRSNSAILNSLLTLLNERTFNNGKVNIKTPIQSIIAATNSWPTEKSLQAFGDRFLFRPTIDGLKKPVSKVKLDCWGLGIEPRPAVGVHMTMDDLSQLQREAEQMPVSENFLEKFGNVWQLLSQHGIQISDRRRVQILRFLQAWAVVQGDDELVPEHMHGSIIHIVYQSEDDKSTILEVLEQEIPTADRIFKDAKRAASGIMSEFTATLAGAKQNATISGLSDYVGRVKKMHADLDLILTKINKIMDGSHLKLTFQDLSKGTKLIQALENNKATLAKALADISTH